MTKTFGLSLPGIDTHKPYRESFSEEVAVLTRLMHKLQEGKHTKTDVTGIAIDKDDVMSALSQPRTTYCASPSPYLAVDPKYGDLQDPATTKHRQLAYIFAIGADFINQSKKIAEAMYKMVEHFKDEIKAIPNQGEQVYDFLHKSFTAA